MYLHIGNFINIRSRDIIGIFDLDTATVSADTRQLLRECQLGGKVETAGDSLPKSFVLTSGGDVYLSQLAASTLKKRLSYYE